MFVNRGSKTLKSAIHLFGSSIPLIGRYRPLYSPVTLYSRSFSTNRSKWAAPREEILVDGCDYEHWLVVMDPPYNYPLRDEIVEGYVKTLAMVLGSEEEAKKSIYSVSTKYYYAFGCKVSEKLSYKIKSLPNVRWVLPDSYLHVKEKDYGGEPFIDGQAVPYEDKYHADWLRKK